MPPDRTDHLPTLARAIAQHRGTSIVLLEIVEDGKTLRCDDCASLREVGGSKIPVLHAMVVSLRVMLERAEAELALHQGAHATEVD